MIVETSDVTKRYGETVALDAVSISVPRGSVYGLVGPNGAGKTTLLAILAGLRRPSGGRVEMDSQRVGVLPDSPRFDPWLTGREVVELSAALGDVDASAERIDGVLGDAGLEDAADRRVGGFSRGMLQRLGLAATVVSDPDLLLLDEPAAALDPAGRRDVLDLVGRLRGRATVVFSSHILDDVQEVCDVIGILRRGGLVYQGALDGLLEGRLPRARFVVGVRGDPVALAGRLSDFEWVLDAAVDDYGHVVVEAATGEDLERLLVPALSALDTPIVSITPQRMTLEDIFLELTR